MMRAIVCLVALLQIAAAVPLNRETSLSSVSVDRAGSIAVNKETEEILQPVSTAGRPCAVVLVGRSDVTIDAYKPLAVAIQTALAPELSAWLVLRR